jgi:hypothetical protein
MNNLRTGTVDGCRLCRLLLLVEFRFDNLDDACGIDATSDVTTVTRHLSLSKFYSCDGWRFIVWERWRPIVPALQRGKGGHSSLNSERISPYPVSGNSIIH